MKKSRRSRMGVREGFWLLLLGIGIGAIASNPERLTALTNNAIAISEGVPVALAQVAQNTPQRRLEISLTISDPSDLKVSEGQQVNKGQILSDRTKERDRLERQKELVLNAIATVGKTKLIPPPEPSLVPAPQSLPPSSLDKESAAIESAELKLRQAQRAYNVALQSDPFLSPTAAVETARHEWEMSMRKADQSQNIMAAIANIPGVDTAEIEHRQYQLEESLRERSRKEAIYSQKEGELRNAQQARVLDLERLQDAIATAQAGLEQAQANYRSAKTQREQKEYEHRLMQTRRVEEANRARQGYAAAKAAYQNRLLSREQQLFNYQQRLDAIDNGLSELAVVRSPYNATIQRIKTESQTNNTINVVVTLLPLAAGDRSTEQPTAPTGNPFLE